MNTATLPVDFEALDACHQEMARQLRALSSLIQHITAHGVDAQARQTAAAIEGFFSTTSRQHHAEEERSVFPPLLESPRPELVDAVKALQQDHGWIEENWIELAPQLRAIASGNDWQDQAEFEHYADVFLQLCQEHIALEESLIYPESKARWANALEARRQRRATLQKA